MKLPKILVILSFGLLLHTATAQQTTVFTNQYVAYEQALSLYDNNQFAAAQQQFEKVKLTTEDGTVEANCAYYIANCAVRLNQQGADDLMQDFVDRYPTSTKRNSAFSDVANYYFFICSWGILHPPHLSTPPPIRQPLQRPPTYYQLSTTLLPI